MSLQETITWDELFAGNNPEPVLRMVQITNGQTLVANQLIAFNTSTLKWVAYDEAGSNGTNVPRAIIKDAITASGDTYANAYVQGCFNEDALVVLSGDSITETVRGSLQDYGIIIKRAQAA